MTSQPEREFSWVQFVVSNRLPGSFLALHISSVELVSSYSPISSLHPFARWINFEKWAATESFSCWILAIKHLISEIRGLEKSFLQFSPKLSCCLNKERQRFKGDLCLKHWLAKRRPCGCTSPMRSAGVGLPVCTNVARESRKKGNISYAFNRYFQNNDQEWHVILPV